MVLREGEDLEVRGWGLGVGAGPETLNPKPQDMPRKSEATTLLQADTFFHPWPISGSFLHLCSADTWVFLARLIC